MNKICAEHALQRVDCVNAEPAVTGLFLLPVDERKLATVWVEILVEPGLV